MSFFMASKLFSPYRIIPTSSLPKPSSSACLHPSRSCLPRPFAHFSTSAMSSSSHTPAYRANGDNGDDANMHGELNEWKYRAPYKVHDNDPNFKVRYRASCHCGKVKYQLSREKPLDAKYCHCRTCQKLHAAPFQMCAIFHKDDINFTHGHHDLGWYESSEKTCAHKLPCKVSCAYCRTPIMDEGRNMILLFPTLIDWENDEDRKNFEVSCHMFYPRRIVDVPDGKPKWSGINESSELVGEGVEPEAAVHKHKKAKKEQDAGNEENHESEGEKN